MLESNPHSFQPSAVARMAEATPVAAVVLVPTQELALSLKMGVENYSSFSPSDGIVAWASGISCESFNLARRSAAAVLTRSRAVIRRRASCTTHRQRRGKASAKRDDRVWRSREEDDTYGSLVRDRRERIVGSLSRRRLKLVMSPITGF